MKKILLLLLAFLLINEIISQENIEFTSSNFPSQGRELRRAIRSISIGDDFIEYENRYDKALEYYMTAYELNPNNAGLNFKIGLCIYNSAINSESLEYFQKAYDLNPRVNNKILYYLGRAYHLNYEFDKAAGFYNNYLRIIRDQKEINHVKNLIDQTKFAKTFTKDTIANINITNLGSIINSEYNEYAPLITADGLTMYFTSRRDCTTGGAVAEDGQYFEDIYVTRLVEGNWTEPENVGRPLNTRMHSAAVGLSPDGERLFVYMDKNGGDIYVSHRRGDGWSRPECIGKNINSRYHESKAAITACGDTLYFISDRPDLSIGGRDIFYSVLDKNGNWGSPVNLGPTINTEYDEIDIFLHPDGETIFFSSEGHNSLGGQDIFRTRRDENGEWTRPENVGFPINTTGDDTFFVTTECATVGYIASIRPDGYGLMDIYQITFADDRTFLHLYVNTLKGTVKDKNTKQPLKANIEIYDITNDSIFLNIFSDELTGEYSTEIESGVEYKINVKKPGYVIYSEKFELPSVTKDQNLIINVELERASNVLKVVVRDNTTKSFIPANLKIIDVQNNETITDVVTDSVTGDYFTEISSGKYDIKVSKQAYLDHSEIFEFEETVGNQNFTIYVDLQKIEVGATVILKNIFFDFDRTTIRKESFIELNKLVDLLNNEPELKIEISGHTDNRGSYEYNLNLSRGRAKAVVDYLVSKGVRANRLTYQGYSFSKPIASNATDEGRQLNRRVEFKVTDYTGEDKFVSESEIIKTDDIVIEDIAIADETFTEITEDLTQIKKEVEKEDDTKLKKTVTYPSDAKWTLQIAASRRALNIENHFPNLDGVQMHVGEDGWYRYYIGAYKTREEVDEAAQNLKDTGQDCFVRKISFFK